MKATPLAYNAGVTIHFHIQTTTGLTLDAATPFQFPGGEWHLKDISADLGVFIADVRFSSADDLVKAALFADVALHLGQPFVLLLPYLPAARADRGQPCGANVYADIINSMGADQVIGIDPHSPVITGLIAELTVLDPFPLLARALHDVGGFSVYDAVICPDKGAIRRATIAADMLGVDCYVADKHRDFDTGKITGITIEKLPTHGRYLVVDDICDGGATFSSLAKATDLPTDRLGLWVTHGIFSGHAPELRQHFGHILTTDSHPGCYTPRVAHIMVGAGTYMLNNIKEWR